MRIIIHSDEYYPTAQACAYRMQVFTDTFMEMGDDVTVITSSANKMNGTIDSAAHKEKIIYAPAVRMTKKSTPMRLLNNLSFAVTSVLYSFGSGKADIVISTSPPPLISLSGWLIAKSKKARLIYDVRDIWPDVALEMGSFTENSFMCSVFRAIARFMYKHADIVTTVSPGKVNKIRGYVRDIGKEKGKNSGEDKVWLAGNGFDESVSRSEYYQSVVDEYELEDKFTCVYIGNIGLAQGLDSLLRVAAETRHKDIQFLLFGKGAEKEMLEKKAQEEGLTNVRFCGPIEHSKVFSVLSKAKLSFISLKTSKMKDSVPTKVYESLGIGCPVILVAEGDSAEIVEEAGLGIHISPDNTDQLVDRFDEMIDHYDDYLVHRDSAIHLMHSKYSRQKIAEELELKLRDLCKAER